MRVDVTDTNAVLVCMRVDVTDTNALLICIIGALLSLLSSCAWLYRVGLYLGLSHWIMVCIMGLQVYGYAISRCAALVPYFSYSHTLIRITHTYHSYGSLKVRRSRSIQRYVCIVAVHRSKPQYKIGPVSLSSAQDTSSPSSL
jgi:hypothetical protein